MAMTTQSGMPWTSEDIAQLRRLAEEGLTAKAIASTMGERAGILKKAVSERLPLDPAKQPSR